MAAKAPRRILVVGGDDQLARNLCHHIEQNSPHATYTASDGLDAVERIIADNPLLVVLDVGLTSIDGFEVCRRVRPTYAGPILFLTGERRKRSQLKGFQSGADDYVIKPTSFDIVLARIESLIRRAPLEPAGQGTTSGVYQLSELEPVQAGELKIDPIWQTVTSTDGQQVSLSPSEVFLLWVLGRAIGQPVTRDELVRALKGEPWDGKSRLPDMLVSKIRKKLKKLKGRPVRIEAAPGVGYVLVVPDPTGSENRPA